MAGALTFRVNVQITGGDKLGELAKRIADLTPVFENIVEQWAKGNAAKFELGQGAEAAGVDVDPSVHWDALKSEAYMKEKRRHGYSDWLMVRTGNLMRSLSDSSQFLVNVTPTTVTFGSPIDPDASKAAKYNMEKRQTIFLGRSDQLMIQQQVQAYLSFGSDYERELFDSGLGNLKSFNESAAMTAEFEGAAGGD